MAKAYKIDVNNLSARLHNNWDLKRALETPVREKGIQLNILSVQFNNLTEACNYFGGNINVGRHMVTKGVEFEAAILEQSR